MTRDERIFRKGFEMGGRVARAVLVNTINGVAMPSKAQADSAWAAGRSSLPAKPARKRAQR